MTNGFLGADRAFALARAFAGAVLFGLPLFYTMEMWSIGQEVDPWRLGWFVAAGAPLLVGLAWYSGFRADVTWGDAVYDALVALLVAGLAGLALLALLGVLDLAAGFREAVGKVAVQLVPAAIGATLARSQLGMAPDDAGGGRRRDSVAGELFLMLAGALFFGLNIAPTEEIRLIAQQTTPWHQLVIVLVTVGGMHAMVYGLQFRGQHERPEGRPALAEFVSLTVGGYILALATCTHLLWVLGRLDGAGWSAALAMVLVLGLPAGLGAATARVAL